MSYRKLISALVFAAFGFYFSEPARAQCDNPDYCGAGDGGAFDNIIGSSVNCTPIPGGEIKLSPGDGTATDPPTFHQVGQATCRQNPGNINLGTCTIDVTMTGVKLSACVNNMLTATAFCQDPVEVLGTLTCASGIMNLGIAGFQRNANKCADVFSFDQNLPNLVAGQILFFTVTTQPDPGGQACTGKSVLMSDVQEKMCNSGPPSFNNPEPDCLPGGGITRRSTVQLDTAVPFEFDVRQTVNTSPTNCKGGKNIDKGSATLEVSGSHILHVSDITTPVTCEGEDLVCDTPPSDLNGDGFPDLSCKIATCPNFGPNLAKLPKNPDGTVTASCRGQLNSGQAILGFGNIAVSPNK